MKISVPVNHNFYEEAPIRESALGEAFSVRKKGIEKLKEIFSSLYDLKVGSEKLNQIKILSFKRNHPFEVDEERLILKLYCKERPDQDKEYFVQTGLYAGVLFYKGCKINITTKYGDSFLKRMLNFVNDIYVDNEQIKAQKDKTENQFLFIIAYLFIQSLEKAAVLGLPQLYKKHQEKGYKVRGRIDFTAYLNRDIPFQGKLSTTFRERKYVQEVVDVLFLALRKLERLFGKEIHARLLGLSQLLKQHYSGIFSSYETIQRAKKHQSINNPLYAGFKKVLEYAEIILMDNDLLPDDDNKQLATTGYLFDIAELFELYMEKLLSRNLPDWQVSSQVDLPIYQRQFFARSIFPDIVLEHKITGKVVVFDAKFKKMELLNRDVDRNDLHQIHSYAGYYRSQLSAIGLLYPLSREIDTQVAYSKTIYGINDNEINFMIDGILVHENQSMNELIKSEEEFVGRITSLLNAN
ncbi:hypothetical protein GO495_29840 [Chitinophaga oryziterrae]|uniref:Restriction endonuclease n=1 Tax=Chitinophaga oryziterrae TaxID=1031224 RepID=A0A6N8JK67_9BACT|nr:hypothetical protein [Chitinophaga oryziterrae]MVT44831.1 hypothetical protein [Chitinophaga oryziterrae]